MITMRLHLPNLDGLVAQVEARLAAVMPAAARGLAKGLAYAAGVAQRKYLSGPRPERLGVVTARLRNSITSRVDEEPDRIVGRIGTSVPYGAYHEYGFHGTVSVRAHTRTVAEFVGVEEVDSRRPIRDRSGRIVGYKESRTASSQRSGTAALTQQVRGHTRRVNYAGRPFLRPALKESETRIAQAIRSEVSKALQGGGQ